jgi:hypothetical protein
MEAALDHHSTFLMHCWPFGVKPTKCKILRIVFHESNSPEKAIDCSMSRQRNVEPGATTLSHGEKVASKITRPVMEDEKRLGNSSIEAPEMKAEDFNDVFPGDVEELYDRPVTTVKRRRIRCGEIERDIVIGSNGTSFLDLPREVRNEIYYYAVVYPGTIWNVRKTRTSKQHNKKLILERLPQLCRAIPLYTEEVLETHYIHNNLRFASYYGDGPSKLLDWIHRRGVDLVKNVRHIQIVHHLNNGPCLTIYPPGHVTTTIIQKPNCTIEATCNQQRIEDDCHCGIAELVQERLLRGDAQMDPDCVHRIEMSTMYGPVLGFTLQLLEAVQLALKHASTDKGLSFSERRLMHEKLPKDCIMCGKRKWAFRY